MSINDAPAQHVPPQESHRGRTFELIVAAVLLAAVVAIVLSNRQTVSVSWVFGSTDQALIWVLVVTAVLGWLLGIVTSYLVRRRRSHRH